MIPMRLCGVLATTAVLVLTVPASAQIATVKGQLVDELCSLMKPPHDNGDAKSAAEVASCAMECARSGQPVALLTADGKLYRVTGGLAANRNAKLIAHMSRTVEIRGEVTERGGKRQIASDSLKVLSK
jgi:hypothetical protein